MTPLARWTAAHLPDLTGRVAVVTGANSGIGLETARGLVLRGAHVVLACRDAGKGEAARADVLHGAPAGRAEARTLDLASLDSVRRFADGWGTGRLDVLVNNAGVMALPHRTTADGFERQFGTNVLGHAALVGRLLPALLGTPGSRTVWVSSLSHWLGRVRFDNLNAERSYGPWRAYAQSKLADLVLAVEMDRRLRAAGAASASVAAHPGYTATALQRRAPEMTGAAVQAALGDAFGRAVGMPAWKGALPSLVAAAGPDVRGGAYIGPTGPGEVWGPPGRAAVSARARDPDVAARLVAVCERLTGVSLAVPPAVLPAGSLPRGDPG